MRRTLHWGHTKVPRGLLALTALLLLVGAGCLVAGLQVHSHVLPAPVPQRPEASAPVVTSPSPAPTASAPAAVVRSVPVAVRVPAIGLAVWLTQLGLNANGTVAVPSSVQVPGWFSPGPSPGQVGSAVILGHVDSYQGPGVFFQLRRLQPGNQIQVNLACSTRRQRFLIRRSTAQTARANSNWSRAAAPSTLRRAITYPISLFTRLSSAQRSEQVSRSAL